MRNRLANVFMVSVLVAFLFFTGARAEDETPAEIDYLLTAVGDSGCTFIRNGDRHTAEKAEDHLRMKYRNGKRYASTAEDFIERLASSSYFSKKPYYVECEDDGPIPSAGWFLRLLAGYRSGAA